MHNLKATVVGLLCLAALTSCTTNTSSVTAPFSTVATLQLAVGSINDTAGVLETGASGGVVGAGTYLNAVSTFRNQLGNSAFLNPGVATLTPGAGAGNIGGLFSYGQSPARNGTDSEEPAFAAPDSGTGYLRDNLLVQLPPLPGSVPTSYTLSTDVPVNGGLTHYTAGATLASLALLGFNGNCAFATDGLGGGTMTCPAAPAGVEQVMMVLNGATVLAGIYRVFEVKAGATTTIVPAGTSAAGARTAFMIDADYPFVEAGPVNAPAVGTATPVITNGAGSPQANMSAGGYFAITL